MTVIPLTHLPPGFVIDGRYEVVAPLGGGAQGDVYSVRDHNTGQLSALKLLRHFGSNPWVEAQILAHVAGEYLLSVRNADHASGAPFIVTEIAQHGTTANRLQGGVGVPEREVMKWLRQASRGVSRLHDLGLVHNDIKPDNLFLDARGDVLVGDVGLAQLLDPLTGRAGWVGGTYVTTSPEVCAQVIAGAMPGDTVSSVANDIYGLGATGYWLLTGHPPYDAPSNPVLLAAIVDGPPVDLLDAAPHVSQGVRDAIRTAMARDPAARYATPAKLDNALGHLDPPARVWTQTPAHAGHTSCFQGVRDSSRLDVCAVPISESGRHEIQVRQGTSGRRTALPWARCTRSELPRALRRAFREHA